jgi:hypothetical protein
MEPGSGFGRQCDAIVHRRVSQFQQNGYSYTPDARQTRSGAGRASKPCKTDGPSISLRGRPTSRARVTNKRLLSPEIARSRTGQAFSRLAARVDGRPGSRPRFAAISGPAWQVGGDVLPRPPSSRRGQAKQTTASKMRRTPSSHQSARRSLNHRLSCRRAQTPKRAHSRGVGKQRRLRERRMSSEALGGRLRDRRSRCPFWLEPSSVWATSVA